MDRGVTGLVVRDRLNLMEARQVQAEAALVLGNHLHEFVIGPDLVTSVALKGLRRTGEQHVGATDACGEKHMPIPLKRLCDVAVLRKKVSQSPAEANDRVMASHQFQLTQSAKVRTVGIPGLLEPGQLRNRVEQRQ